MVVLMVALMVGCLVEKLAALRVGEWEGQKVDSLVVSMVVVKVGPRVEHLAAWWGYWLVESLAVLTVMKLVEKMVGM